MQNQHEFIRRLPSLFIPIACIVEFVVPDILVTDTELEQKQMELLYSHNYGITLCILTVAGIQFRASFLVTVYDFFLPSSPNVEIMLDCAEQKSFVISKYFLNY